jgi:hypothetical protein
MEMDEQSTTMTLNFPKYSSMNDFWLSIAKMENV